MANGILVVDKAAGWTSHDVVAKLRGILRERRIGHGGTLDPMATGVLPVFIGRATRAVSFAAESDKEYIAGLRLGLTTDTQDITGTVLDERPAAVTPADVESALGAFRGELMQVPPMYSAVRHGGKKLYELARMGKEVERPPRPVTIYTLEILKQTSPSDYTLRAVCSKGTYIRTLCHEIGHLLGCGGVLSSLRRTRVGEFTLARALTLEQITACPSPLSLLLPVDTIFMHCPAVFVSGEALRRAKNGNPFDLPGKNGTYRVYGPDGEFLLLGERVDGRLATIKSFFEV